MTQSRWERARAARRRKSKRRRHACHAEWLEHRVLLAGEPKLLMDLNLDTWGSTPSDAIVIDDTLMFFADDGVHGRELWRSDGTTAGTWMVRDIRPGGAGSVSYGTETVVADGNLYFSADDGVRGTELWCSDGTEAGTRLVKDIDVGLFSAFGSNPRQLFAAGGLVYFTSSTYDGYDLWRTDGTEVGTVALKHSRDWGSFNQFAARDGLFCFQFSGDNGIEMWKSDGTVAGTVPTEWIQYGSFSPVELNGARYWPGYDAARGPELWMGDGTAGGSAIVADIRPGPEGSSVSQLTAYNDALYFVANGGLWKTDGTAAGTQVVRNDLPGYPVRLTVANGLMYFRISDLFDGGPLWQSDGTAAGTRLVIDVPIGMSVPGVPGFTKSNDLYAVNGTLYLNGNAPPGREPISGALWRSDGTAAGTQLVGDFNPDHTSGYQRILAIAGSTLYLIINDGAHGDELWKTDGTPAGTSLVKDICTDTMASAPRGFVEIDGIVYFVAQDGLTANMLEPNIIYWDWRPSGELYRTDGTVVGTYPVKDIYPGPDGANPRDLAVFDGRLTFSVSADTWTSDGTAGGTVAYASNTDPAIERRIFAGDNGVIAGNNAFALRDRLLWVPELGEYHRILELWKSDGTPAGTVFVKEIDRGSVTTPLVRVEMEAIGNTLYFTADDGGVHGAELWRTDGTAAGTVLVKDINPGTGNSDPSGLTNVNGVLYFVAGDGASGRELWRSDGTPDGTCLVRDINPGDKSSPGWFTSFNGILYFIAEDGVHGLEVWRTDGTAAGTAMVADVVPGSDSPFLLVDGHDFTLIHPNFTPVGNLLYFTATNSNYDDVELWRTDGTAAGTFRVKDIGWRINGSWPADLTNVEGVLYFTAEDFEHGRELWMTDGTEAGTRIVTDIVPGPGSSSPANLAYLDGTLYFTADPGGIGHEIFTLPMALRVKDVVDISPDPRRVPLSSADVVFSMPVDLSTLDYQDLSLTRDGAAVPLDGRVTVSRASENRYRIDGLDAFTSAEGTYILTVRGQGVQSINGLTGSGERSDRWIMDLTAPALADVVDVSPDPRISGVATVDVAFSEPIQAASFTPAAVSLSRDGVPIALGTAVTLTQLSPNTWRIGGLGGFTIPGGTYTLTVSADGVLDIAGNAGSGSASDTWIVTGMEVAAMADIAPNPRITSVSSVDVTFSEPIQTSSLTTADLILTRNGVPVSVSFVTVSLVSGSTYRISGLDNATKIKGTYVLTVNGAGVLTPAGKVGSGTVSRSWVHLPLSADIVDVSPDPRTSAVSTVDVVFSEPIQSSTFTLLDLTLTRDGVAVPMTSVPVTLVSGNTYRISGLDAYTRPVGHYKLTVNTASITDATTDTGTDLAVDEWDVSPVAVRVLAPIDEGQSATIELAIASPPPTPFTVRLDFGDGYVYPLILDGGTTSFSFTYQYPDDPPGPGQAYAITASIAGPAAAGALPGFSSAVGQVGSSPGTGNAVALDGAGNIYLLGQFFSTADLDPGTGSLLVTSAGERDIFIVKLNPAGQLLWGRQIGGTGYDAAFGLAVDSSGSLYIGGEFSGSVDMDPGAGISTITSAADSPSTRNGFVLKLDTDGNFQWVAPLTANGSVAANAIALDPAGNAYVTGSAAAGMRVSGGTAVPASGFLLKLNSSGALQWSSAVGNANVTGTGVAVDASGNAFTTGYFVSSADFNPGAGVTTLTSAGNSDIYIACVDNTGLFAWARRIGGSGADRGRALAVGSDTRIRVTGSFAGTVDFDPGSGVTNLVAAGTTSTDAFVMAVDYGGNLRWARQMGSADSSGNGEYGAAIAVDPLGNTYTTGVFVGTVDFDPGPAAYPLTDAGNAGAFISKLDRDGNFVWASGIVGASGESTRALAIEAQGNNLMVFGTFGSAGTCFNGNPQQVVAGNLLKLDQKALGSAVAIVNNLPPQVQAGDDLLLEGTTVLRRNIPFTDVFNADTWTGWADYGDGTGLVTLTRGQYEPFALWHHYLRAGTFTVTVTVRDDDGGEGTDSFVVTVPEGGSISGRTFEDRDADGILDNDEAVLEGRTVYIDGNENGIRDPEEPFAVTDSSGEYLFASLTNAYQVVREDLAAGYARTVSSRVVLLTGGRHEANVNLGSVPTRFASIGGAASSYEVRKDASGSNLEVLIQAAGSPRDTYAVPLAGLSSLEFAGGSGDDRLTLTGTLPIMPAFSGGGGQDMLVIASGEYVFAASAPDTTRLMSVVALGDAVVRFNEPRHLASLSIGGAARVELAAGGSAVLRVDRLALEAGGTIDLADNALIIQAGAQTRQAVLESVTGWVAAGRAAGGWNGAGIRSSVAAADALRGVAVVSNSRGAGLLYSEFRQTNVDADSILVSLALQGDLDLSGIIDGDDYFAMDAAFLAGARGYAGGDLNYDGRTDGADFLALDRTFLAQPQSLIAPASAAGTDHDEINPIWPFPAASLAATLPATDEPLFLPSREPGVDSPFRDGESIGRSVLGEDRDILIAL